VDDELVRFERRQVAIAVGRKAIEIHEVERPPAGLHRRAESEERSRRIRRVRGRATLVAEDRVLAVLAVPRVAAVAAVQVAREVEPPVPAARGLKEVAADRAHVAKLRRGGEAAGFPQCRGNVLRVLELGERGAGADAFSVDAARKEGPDVDERIGLHEPVADERHEISPAC
jgi:hypothetical protein